MKLTEDKLASAIKAGNFSRVYYIYGKEPFLINMYVDRIIEKAVGADANDFNLRRFEGNPDPDMLSDVVDTLPVFTEYKVVTVKDFSTETRTTSTDKQYLEIVANVPESAILVFYCINIEPDEKKARTKKFIDAVNKAGTVCSIDAMKAPKIAALCVKKAAKEGVVISDGDALFLTERVGGKMQVASDETAKLISYVGNGGVIDRGTIELLVPKLLEAEAYDLADAINAGRRADAYRIIDELFRKQVEAVQIMAALSGTFFDMYCANLAKNNGIGANEATKLFGHYGGKAWVFTNHIYTPAARLDTAYLRETVRILSETDIELKSIPVDGRVQVEKAVTRLFECRERRGR